MGAGIAITGCGSAAPESILTNDHLAQIVETNDEWIRTRTGMRNRHIASPTESLSQLSAIASNQAIAMAGISPLDIDLIILATSTPDDMFGSACKIQGLIGASNAVAFDLTAACSGFLFALITASQFISTGAYQNVLIIGADVLSRWVDWSDRTSCILFGDGAGAAICQRVRDNRLLSFGMYSNGSQNDSLNLNYHSEEQSLVDGVTAQQGSYSPISMNGREVYRFAVAKVPEAISKAMFQANITADDIDWLLLHQANQRIMDAVAKRLKIPQSKILSNIAEYGNTSAASIPLALNAAVRDGRIKTGDVIAASGFGAGLTWGAAIFKWG